MCFEPLLGAFVTCLFNVYQLHCYLIFMIIHDGICYLFVLMYISIALLFDIHDYVHDYMGNTVHD